MMLADMSIRLRLTLWYAAVMAFTLIGGSVALYLVLAFNVLQPAGDQLLASRGNGLASGLARRALQAPASGESRRPLLPPAFSSLAEGDLSASVKGPAGDTLERSANLGEADLPLSDSARTAALDGQPSFESATVQGVPLRLYTAPVVANGQAAGFVQVARSTRDIDQTLSSLRRALLIGNSILVLLGAVVGWFLAGRSLEPVRRITRTAEDIERSGELDRRVFYKGPRDDLGELAIAFNNMLSRLDMVFNAQRRFVADASHELRTPLTTLRVNVDVLRRQRELAPVGWGEVLDDLSLELARLTRLVEGLLDLARADTGYHLPREPIALDPLLERVERQAGALTREVQIELRGGAVGVVMANGDALTQLFLILLDNAVKYTPSGGLVRLERERENGVVRVRVSDSGAGIAPEDLPHLFDRFYRAPAVRGRPGTGLGLAIARWIAEEHQGHLTVRSTVGQGSSFTVTLPAGGA
jgi:signal transduction histidine kinase